MFSNVCGIHTKRCFQSLPRTPSNESWGEQATILHIPISEGGKNSSHTHNLAKSQSHRGMKLLLSDNKFMTMVYSMFIYHKFQDN
jgi:hypothetical protein